MASSKVRSLKLIGGAAGIGAGIIAYKTRPLSEAQLVNLATRIDDDAFNGGLAERGVTPREIAAMWLTESAGDPRATNFMSGDGRRGGAWGLGQVTALTATDYNIPMMLAPIMLLPSIGGRISMEHVAAVIDGLRRAGLSGSAQEWVQAYNVGTTGYVNGARNLIHKGRFLRNLERV